MFFTGCANVSPSVNSKTFCNEEAIFVNSDNFNGKVFFCFSPYVFGETILVFRGMQLVTLLFSTTSVNNLFALVEVSSHFVEGNFDTREFIRIIGYNITQRE